MKKVVLVLLVLGMMISPIFAAGSKEATAKEETVVIWSFGVSVDALDTIKETIIKDFNANNPNITVDWQYIPYEGFREKLLTAAAGSVLPDIFIDGFNMLGSYHSAGIITPIDDRIAEWDGYLDIQKSVRDLTYYQGEYYGLPFRTKVYPMLINIELFEAAGLDPDNPPETWTEVLEVGKKILKVENGRVITAGITGLENKSALIRAYDLFVQQDGGDFLNEDGTPGFNDQHGLNALKFITDLYKMAAPDSAARIEAATGTVFTMGKSGIDLMQSYDSIEYMLQAGDTEMQSKTRVVAPLESGGPDGKKVCFFDGDMMFIASTSDKKDAAWEFMKYFYEPENFLIYAEANKCIPIYDSLMDSDYMNANPLLQQLMAVQHYGGKLAATPAYRSARNFLGDQIERSILAGQSFQETLDKAEVNWLKEIEDLK
jgi:ABC-type glycerol-3-phosphate transport system substrate-binding protein